MRPSMTQLEVQARSIFWNALERTGDDVEEYVKSACVADTELRRRVDQLLQAHRERGEVDATNFALAPSSPSPCELSLDSSRMIIGPYRLLEQIGEGGFGIVYMAEQTQPVRRKVALKIIKPG